MPGGVEVGRNKAVRALSAGQAFPAFRCSEEPETPSRATAGWAYSGLRLAFNMTMRLFFLVPKRRTQRTTQ
jgi:hypothetical protein